ncbi:LytR family transcriptional regulator [Streptomyces inusitatus]|uniref:LytR family transcriptional regulator n=1 Tax=Streptomyces inusitatus TaxID=68221 RepID=A0A918QSD1_9ACTN|nr:LCP family protein [Streptomyces inusitatus]GGZ63659.1 LytR family transcriptional regulator [Streptomyces inusitatus]
MDAQSRGQADDFDPADQWVLNPETGQYELRLDNSAAQSPAAPAADGFGDGPGTPGVPGPRTPGDPGGGRSRPEGDGNPSSGAEVPEQRSRRSGGRAANRQAARSGRPAGGASAPAGRRKGKSGKPAKSGKKKVLMWTGGVLGFTVVVGSVGAYLAYDRLNSNLNTIAVPGAGTGGFKKDKAVNILVIGTDKRTGKGNGSYGDPNSAGHADTTILFHVSKDRTNATALSIPRDLITDIPACETKTDKGTVTIPGSLNTKFNESLGQEGRDPGCTMRAVKELTGVTVDHFMMADFNAVKTMSTAVGGVEVCLAKDIDDKKSKLKLARGTHVIKGEQALAFVRTRYTVGFGSDLSRIEIQQQFLSSMIRKMKSSDTLTSPTKMWDLANAATKALTVDTGIGSIEKLQDLGMELAEVDPKNITFATVPVDDSADKSSVLLNEAKARPLFSMIQNDISLTEVKKKEKQEQKAAKEKQNALLKGDRAEAADVRVKIYNGSGTQGVALATLTWLQNDQSVMKSSNEGNAPAKAPKTTLEYAPNQADQARKLADLMGLPATAMKPGTEDAEALEAMTLVLGADFKGAGVPITGVAKTPDGVQKVEADKKVCAG